MLNFQNCYHNIQWNSEVNCCEVLKKKWQKNICERVLKAKNKFKVKNEDT